jgi:glyoxylase-like metal-dependent hydrolase (beta-lactamase superfamily II)
MVKGLSKLTTHTVKVLPDITMFNFKIVNACVIGDTSSWVLVDTGLENSYDYIIEQTEAMFGKGSTPAMILLTHGHFDHIGCVIQLSEHWNVDVYAHEEELAYLTGKKNYPEPNPDADEGMVAKMSPAFPNEGINLFDRIKALPKSGYIPDIKDWEWIHTPGHTEGHVSFFRKRDKVLIVGDAFTTTKQESFLSVLTEREKVKGPPAYLTPDWMAAKESVEKLKNIMPELVIPSHGKVMQGEELKSHLAMLAEHFNEIAIPR